MRINENSLSDSDSLTDEEIIERYFKSGVALGAFQTLLASFVSFSFILPPTDQQNSERQRDINIGTGGMAAALIVDIAIEFIKSLNRLPLGARIKINNVFNHLRVASLKVAVILEFLRNVAAILAENAGENPDSFSKLIISFSAWLSGQDSTVRAVIGVTLVAVMTFSNSYFTSKAYGPVDEDNILLQSRQMNRRAFNKISSLRWFANLIYVAISRYVFSTMPIIIIESFGAPVSNNFKLYFPATVAGISVATNFIPDAPFVKGKFLRPKQAARFIDNFIEYTVCYAPLAFMVWMNSQTTNNIIINNNTALTSIILWLYPNWRFAEIAVRVKSVFNDNPSHIGAPLKIWDFAVKEAKAIMWWAQIMEGNLYALAPALGLALTDFMLSWIGPKNEKGWKKFGLELAGNLNDALFMQSLILKLFRLNDSKWSIKAAEIVPVTLLLMALKANAERYPAVNKLISLIESSLIASGVFYAVQQFAKPFSFALPPQVEYALVSAAATGVFVYHGHEFLLEHKRKNYDLINSSNQQDSAVTSTYSYRFYNFFFKDKEAIKTEKSKLINAKNKGKNGNENQLNNHIETEVNAVRMWDSSKVINGVKAMMLAAIFTISLAALNEIAETINVEPTTSTGNGAMLLLLCINLLILMSDSYDNLGYKNSVNSTNKNTQSYNNNCLTGSGFWQRNFSILNGKNLLSNDDQKYKDIKTLAYTV